MIEKERKKKSGIQCIVLPKRTHLKANVRKTGDGSLFDVTPLIIQTIS
jgi:hypothetical protein